MASLHVTCKWYFNCYETLLKVYVSFSFLFFTKVSSILKGTNGTGAKGLFVFEVGAILFIRPLFSFAFLLVHIKTFLEPMQTQRINR